MSPGSTARVSRALVALALTALLAASTPALADGPAPTKQAARYEISFMEDMIDHHYMAVMMAEICLDRATHTQLEELCQQIITTQSAEIEQMQSWLEDWYGIEYEPQMSRQMQQDLQALAELSGAKFEVAFLTMMVEHHEVAVREGERCVDRAYHESLISLCEDIVKAQSAEIELMEEWLCDWYDICQDR